MRLFLVFLLSLFLLGCDSEADVASRNLSTGSDNFEVNRRIVFYNGITGQYMLTIEGLCSKDNSSTAGTLGIVCKVGPNSFKKHMLGLSDNVSYIIEQVDPVEVNKFSYRVIFNPKQIIPDIDVRH